MSQDYKFEGWLGLDKKSVEGNMVWKQFEPKEWEETDVDIQVTHSGICGSDLHSLRSGWGETSYPICVGHEIVGKVVRVGSNAEGNLKVGDRVGVGAQSDSCLGRQGDCEECANGEEAYCTKMVATFGGPPHFNGGKAMGGHANYHRCPSHFVIKIPEGLESANAAPMLCGGATMYSPLKHFGCGPGKKVGIIGVGGLGHFGVIFAKALGADRVVGISRKGDKRDDILKMGADEYIATDEENNWEEKHARSLDLIISTVSSTKAPMRGYLGLVKKDGVLVQVGAPDADEGFPIHPFDGLITKRISFTGSSIGSPNEIREMLDLAAKKNIKPWVEQRPMSEANRSMVDLSASKVRYRFVLVN